MLLPKPINNQ